MTRVNDVFAKLVSVVASAALVVGLMPLPTAAFADDGSSDADSRNTATPLTVGTIATEETSLTIGAQSTEDVVQVNTWDGLQDAIDNASDGKTIQLSDNVVNPVSDGAGVPWIDNVLHPEGSHIKVEDKTVTIDLAGYTLNRNLSSVKNSGHVIEVFDGAELTITDSSENGTGKITGGYSKWGGGIFVNENATLIIQGGTITGNFASERGGGIYAKKNSTVVIKDGAIANNKAKSKAGGGIYVLGNLTMTGGRIEGNESDEAGGGIFAGEESSINLKDAVISGNIAHGSGGGINVKSQTDSSIENCEIIGNRASKYGGGMYVDVDEEKTFINFTITGARTKIDGNTASNAGGGIAVAGGTVNMTGGTVSRNKSEGDYGGGGIWVWTRFTAFSAEHVNISNNQTGGKGGGLLIDNGVAALTRCSIKDNSADGSGGGIYNYGDLALDDCTVSGNSSGVDGGGIYDEGGMRIRSGGSFTGNTAAGKGGGIYVYTDAYSPEVAGPVFITGNTAVSGGDLYLGKGRKLKLTGDVEGSRIGSIDMEQVGVFTELYSDFHPNVEPRTFFGTDGMTLPVVWSDDHTEAQLSSNWPALQAMIAEAEAHPNDPAKNPIVLQNDYIASSADVKLKVNGTVTIDLNGHTINRNLQQKGSDGQVVEVYEGAVLTIMDDSTNKTGKITGGWPYRGGGIYVNKNAELAIGGGAITGNHSEKAGGGIYVLGKLTMTGGRIENNIAGESGGGIFAGAESSISLKNVVITGNTAHDNGGAINVKSQTDSSIENCEMTANRADKCGGGVYVDMNGATLTVSGTSTKIDDNKASDDGGGIYLAHGTVAMTEGSISGNTAANDSGAVKVNGDDAILIAESVTIEKNKAQAKEAGGIKNWGTTTLVNCTVKNNTAKLQGGGIYNGSYDSSPGKLTLEGCTISDNSTISDGGGVYSSNKLSIKGGKVSGNSARRGGGIHIGGDAKETSVEGAVVVQGNSASERGNDMFLHSGKKLTCAGALASGAAIGVDLENGAGVLTKDYGKKNGTTDPSLYFVATAGYEVLLNDDGEVEFGSDWAEIKSQIENAEDGETVPLTKDYTALPSDDAIFIQSGKSVTVDLNGHSLNRNRHSSEREGYVFGVSGNLTLKDNSSDHTGAVTGGWAEEGGGILVKGVGTLNFESGTICGNKAGAGGGISNYGTLNMTGGVVRNNVSEGSGGGIDLAVYGKLNFESGIISDNSAAEYGGGIQAGDFTEISIQGKPVVYSNKAAFAGDDVYLTFISDFVVGIEFWPRINVTGALQPGAQMGIALEEDGMVHTGGYEFTRGYSDYDSSKDPGRYFTSTDGYAISLSENGEAVMKPSSHGETEYEKPFIDLGDQVNTGSLNNRNWMSGISGERYLNEINMPGTHDAGMKNVQALDTLEDPSWAGWIAPEKSAMFATTQISTIAQQLDAGSRQLDIRLSNRKKVHEGSNRRYVWEDDGWSLWVCHGKDDTLVGTYYALREDEVLLSLADVLMDVETFLQMHPTETVMLNLRVENGDASKIRQRARTILEGFNYMNPATGESFLYKESGSDSYFAPYTHMPQLKDCRGKIVLLLGDEEFREAIGGFDAEEMVEHSDGTAWDAYKLTPDNLIDSVTGLYARLNPGSNSKPLPTNATAGDYPLWYWELNCTSEEEGEFDTYVVGDEGPIDNANIVNPTLIGDEKLFGPLVNGQYIGWVRLDAFEAKYAEPIWRTNFPDDLEYCTVTVESGLGNPNYSTQVYKVLKGTQITIPGNIYKNLDNKYLRCWKATWTNTNTSTTPEVWYPGDTFVVEASVKFEAQWMDEGQIPVTIIWKDGDNTDGLRPDANDGLTLNVRYSDGSTKSMVIKEEQGWSGIVTGDVNTIVPDWSLIDLGVGNGFGQDAVGQYRYELSHQSGTGFVLSLIHTPETMISTAGSVVWNDDDDAELIRPTSAKVHLFANGAEVATKTVTAADGWDFDFTLKPKYMDGAEIDYEITEDRVEGYNTVIDGFSVVNTHVGRERNSTDVIGIVEWDDGNNARGERPGSITVRLRANGEEHESKKVKAGEYDFWNFSFNGVPAVDSQGQEITYSIIVDEISGYTSSVESPSGNAFRIMNTLIADPDDKEPATLAQAPKADDLVYTGDAQPLVTEGSCSGGTLMYALGGDSESAPSAESYGTELPAETDADAYYVWYYVKGDALHADTVPACVTATIGKRPATIKVDDASKEQGEDDPIFTGTVEGLVAEGDLGEIRYTRTNDDEAPGTYAGVLDAAYTANPNYDVGVSKGDFTIKALLAVRWLDGDGSLLQEKTYVEGEPAPAYDGGTPVKAATAKYSYKFAGWDGGTAKGAVRTFRPLFAATPNKYKVKFVNYDGSVLQSAKVAYGKMPRFVGKTPTRAASARRTFTFKGWAPKVKKVTRAITYKAKYASKARKFAAPIVKLTAKGKRRVVASWTKVAGADGYDVFFSRCDHDGKRVVPRKAGTVKAGDALMWEKAGLKPHASYKVQVRAYVSIGGKKVYVRSSRSSHAYASGGTKARTNAKGVSVNKASVSLAKGGSFQLKARVVKLDERKKLMPANHVARLRYLSSDKSVATVGAEGRVRGVARGTCSVYAIAHNGACKKVRVRVR